MILFLMMKKNSEAFVKGGNEKYHGVFIIYLDCGATPSRLAKCSDGGGAEDRGAPPPPSYGIFGSNLSWTCQVSNLS